MPRDFGRHITHLAAIHVNGNCVEEVPVLPLGGKGCRDAALDASRALDVSQPGDNRNALQNGIGHSGILPW